MSGLIFGGELPGGVGGASFNGLGSSAYGAGLSTGLTGMLYGQTYNVFAYGAVGNGLSNPASSLYGSNLSALQAVYGTTLNGVQVALTQELDWLAAQKAVFAASLTGGVIYFPAAVYVMCNGNSVADGSGGIVLPYSYVLASPNTGVSLLGDYPGTCLTWPVDLGTGVFAVNCGGTTTFPVHGRTNGGGPGFLEGMFLKGPGVGGVFGTSGCQMQGLGSSDRRIVQNCQISGFWAGLNVVGGQTTYKSVLCFNNYYSAYFDNPDPNNFGNINIERCLFSSNLMASIGVHHAACFSADTFYGCFLGTSPFGIYKETNSANGGPTQPQIMTDTQFINCQFEGVGQAAVSEDTYTSAPNGSNRYSTITRSQFIDCQFQWDTLSGSTFHITGSTKYAWFDIGGFTDLKIIGICQPYQMTPGTVGLFTTSANNGFTLSGDINTLITNCTSASSPYNNKPIANCYYQYGTMLFENTVGAQWKGTYGQQDTSGSDVTVGQFVCESTVNVGYQYANLLTPCVGNSTETPIGVVMHIGAPGNFNPRLYAYEGYVTVNVASVANGGTLLRTSTTAGALTAASGPFQTTSPVVAFGFGVAPQSGSGQMIVRLRGLS